MNILSDYLLSGVGPLSLAGGAYLTNRGNVHIYLIDYTQPMGLHALCVAQSFSPLQRCGNNLGNYVTFLQAKGRMWHSKNSNGDLLTSLLCLSSVPSWLVDGEGWVTIRSPDPDAPVQGKERKRYMFTLFAMIQSPQHCSDLTQPTSHLMLHISPGIHLAENCYKR